MPEKGVDTRTPNCTCYKNWGNRIPWLYKSHDSDHFHVAKKYVLTRGLITFLVCHL